MLFSNTKKNTQRLLKTLSLAAAMVASHNTVAQEDGAFFGKQAAGKWIIGAKAAIIDPNELTVSDSKGVGIVLGYEFARSVGAGKSSFEIEYIVGDEEDAGTTLLGTYEANVLNAFFTYRSPGDLYYKIKGGLSYVDIDRNFDDVVILGEDLSFGFEDTAFAFGVGLGYRINNFGMIELEYSQDFGDADLGIIGLNGLLTF